MLEVESETAKFDLTLMMAEDEAEVERGRLNYNTDLFEAGASSGWWGTTRSCWKS